MAAAEARSRGRGGIIRVAAAAGMSRSTVTAAVQELKAGLVVTSRTRRPGGGAKAITQMQPGVVAALRAVGASDSRGDPESPWLNTLQSTQALSAELDH